jgi:hypothetical protein
MTAMHGLKEGEQGYLLSHKRLVSHLLEKNCERLILFQEFAWIDLEMCQKLDQHENQQSGAAESGVCRRSGGTDAEHC